MRSNRGLLMMLVSLALACAGHSGKAGDSVAAQPGQVALTGVNWRLIALGDQSPVQSSTGIDLSLLLTSQRNVSGYSGCNQFTGTYTVSGDTLRFGPLATTRAACMGSARLEQQYLQALAAVNRYVLTTDSLTLFQGSTPLAVYKR
ncbi:MAG TPA: META domain-containing protein, partial [Gemmatimonadales bacterium]|nr:META domain-containing protein [Gemmatimonadales bacterium]